MGKDKVASGRVEKSSLKEEKKIKKERKVLAEKALNAIEDGAAANTAESKKALKADIKVKTDASDDLPTEPCETGFMKDGMLVGRLVPWAHLVTVASEKTETKVLKYVSKGTHAMISCHG